MIVCRACTKYPEPEPASLVEPQGVEVVVRCNEPDRPIRDTFPERPDERAADPQSADGGDDRDQLAFGGLRVVGEETDERAILLGHERRAVEHVDELASPSLEPAAQSFVE